MTKAEMIDLNTSKTIDEWMEDKKPGEIILLINNKETFKPYFRTKLCWHGTTNYGDAQHWDRDDVATFYLPPKKKKKVTLFRPIRKLGPGLYESSGYWSTDKLVFNGPISIVQWEKREIEVDDND